ncbi:MAG: hypothetical protein B7Z02_08675 [Rhodobacterales bacterium 32-67-9]|nr:MAG: hypothetical protein B7Z02_08675 [Rhodobacterales bacterium 32-67-9]
MRTVLAVLGLVLLPLAVIAQEMSRADPPAWVEIVAVPASDPALVAASRDGVYYPLVDTQTAWEGETRLTYYRVVTEVTDRAGLESAATVSSDFDPTSETLTLTRLDVRRGDAVISYRDTLESEVFRRETRLEAGIIDGTLTARLQIPDLRVGDIVDAVFLHRSRPVLPGANRGAASRLEFGVPVGLTRYVALWPEDWALNVGAVPDRVEHSDAPGVGITRHERRRSGHVPPPDESMTPVEYSPDAILRFGAWADWSPLAAALSPYYLADYPLPPDWEAKLDRIRADHEGDLARATAALRLVQDEIRYVGIEVGAGGYFARPPTVVATQGFGDCKDKALLLRVLLSRLGIAAYPALADLDAGYALPGVQPALTAFDHMILRIDIGGVSYWVDPTGSHEGGRIDIAPAPDYGYALPLTGPGQATLDRIDITGTPRWQSATTERFAFTFAGVFLTVDSEYQGSFANSRRYAWATRPHEEIGRGLLDFYAGTYPGIREIAPLSIEDDRDANLVRMKESYLIPAGALKDNGLDLDFAFAAEDFGDYYPSHLSGARRTPLGNGEPRRHSHTVKVFNAPISFNPPAAVKIEKPAFAYSYSGTAPGAGRLTMDWRFESRDRVIPADAVAGVIRDARRIGDSSGFTWDLTPEDEAVEEPAAN